MRLSDILRRNGWVRTKKRIDGKLQWSWEKLVTEVGTPSNLCPATTLEPVFPPNSEVGTEVGTPSNPCHTTTLDTVFPPVPTFLPKDSSKNTAGAEADILIRNQTPKLDIPGISGNQGGNTCFSNSQNPLGQGLEGVPTSPQQGGNISPKLEKVTDEDAHKLRDIALLW